MKRIGIILIGGSLFLLIFFLSNPLSHQVRAWKKILAIIFAVLAAVFIIVPEESNKLAHKVGVGRGADLLLYVSILVFIFIAINFYVTNQQEKYRMTKVIRKQAILEANLRNIRSK